MEQNYVIVEYVNNINTIIKQTFKSMRRIKLLCFDINTSYVVFGSSTGGIYIFRKDPCEFLKLIPSREGSLNLIKISPNERYIATSSYNGFILIIEISKEDAQFQTFREHEGSNITCLKWLKNRLYAGDDLGRISVTSVENFPSKTIFQIRTVILMILDSSIVQIDTFKYLLLISTQTKSYICDTVREYYVQIGKKLRNGYFGACFASISTDIENCEMVYPNNISLFKFLKADNDMTVLNEKDLDSKIYCARPGAKLWDVGLNGQVHVTYQFKTDLINKLAPSEILLIDCGENAILQKSTATLGNIPDNFNFQKLFCIRLCDQFLITFDSCNVYIFSLVQKNLLFWTPIMGGIKDIVIIDNNIYIWKNNLCIRHLSVVDLESLLLRILYNKQYYLCLHLCYEFMPNLLDLLDASKRLYLLSILKRKIQDKLLLEKISPIFQKIYESNEKILTIKPKRNFMDVEILNLTDKIRITLNNSGISGNDQNNEELKIIMKQYNLNKTHSLVDIPEVSELFTANNGKKMLKTLKLFKEFVKESLEEDATSWCQLQYLKRVSEIKSEDMDLSSESLQFLTEALFRENELVKFSCSCGYPLPKAHRHVPKFFRVALDILESNKYDEESMNNILKNIPYLWKYRLKSEIYGFNNIPAIIQYSNLELFKESAINLTCDKWHDVLGYFVKINKGLCVNCDKTIDVEYLFTWTELSTVILQSLGSRNTLRILEKYQSFITNGELDASFYQMCIFVHTFIDPQTFPITESEGEFTLKNEFDNNEKRKFQEVVTKYLARKYINDNFSFESYVGKQNMCLLCNLPLNNDDLRHEYHTIKNDGLTIHKSCLIIGSNKNCN